MSFKQFSNNDMFKNTLVTYPEYNFKIYAGNVYLNNDQDPYVKLLDLNIEDKFTLLGKFDFSVEEQSSLISLL